MTKRTVANNFLYYIFCGFSGAVTSLIVWLFLKLMGLGIGLVWDTIPSNFDFKFYPIIVCTAGGIILGIWQKLTNAVPDELDEVMKKVKKDKFYPYNKVLLLCVSALLPLVFGGSLGPEAGLTGVIVGLCYWAGSHMKDAKSKIPELMQIGISTTLSAVFYAPLFGLASVSEERLDSEEKPTDIRSTKLISNIIAVLFAAGTLFLLNSIFGGSMGLPRLGGYNITNFERLWGIPLALLGAVCGFLFIIASKFFGKFFALIQGKLGIIISTTLGGIILGVMGTYLPLTMFSGEESITVIKESFAEFAPWILIISGILKLVLTNICIKSGWKGGHFFPVIFCGVSIGYGVAMLGGLDTAFCAAVVTAGLLGVTMKKPLAVTMLLLLCFDARVIPWILLAAFLGSIIPTKIFGNNKEKAK
jgi:H+/Cl- antiporter ClcA